MGKKNETATGGEKGKENPTKEATGQRPEIKAGEAAIPTMSEEQKVEMRQRQKAACSKEIDEVLRKYGCDLTAQILVGPNGNIPQVFIVDAKPKQQPKG